MLFLNKLIDHLRNKKKIKLAHNICNKNKVHVAHEIENDDASVIIDIYLKRVYNTCFPFYADSVIVDIGAHKGLFSIFCEKYSGNNSKIYALEPEPSNFDKLTDNIRINNCSKVIPLNFAVSNITGTKKLYISNSVNHSLIKVHQNHPYIHQNTSIKIQTISLSDFIRKEKITKIDFLKIDCEGCEYEILLQSKNIIFDYINTIALEFHDLNSSHYNVNTLVNHLINIGYEIIKYEFQETPLPLQMGILVLTKKHP